MNDELSYLVDRTVRGLYSRRDFLGRAIAMGVGAATANSMIASAVQAAGPKGGGTLQMGLTGGQSSDRLDPALAASWVPIAFLSTMGNYLVTASPEGELIPSLALSWNASPDATVWTFQIRKGIEFHNGKTLTPEDVLLSVKRHSDKSSSSGAFGILQNIADMKVDGDHFVVTLRQADAEFPYVMGDYHLVIQPGGGAEHPDAGIFSGAYRLKEFEPGVRIVMEKFENYWDNAVGHFDQVEILVINDDTARMAALQSGNVQLVNQVQPRISQLMKKISNIITPSVAGRNMFVFNMFCDTSPFDDNNMRMALKLAIDRESMLEKILAGYGTVGNDMPVNRVYPLFDTTIPQRQYDPDQAAHYYKKTGHSGDILLLTASSAFPGAVDAAELFQQSAKASGINIKVQRVPNDGYWSEVWNKKPFSASNWAGRSTQGQMYATGYTSSSEWNDTRFKVPKFDALISAAMAELDEAKRKEIYSDAGRLIRDEGGLITPLFNNYIDGYRGDKISGWINNPNRELMNGLAAVKCWQT